MTYSPLYEFLDGIPGMHRAQTPDGAPAFYFTAPHHYEDNCLITSGYRIPKDLRRHMDLRDLLLEAPLAGLHDRISPLHATKDQMVRRNGYKLQLPSLLNKTEEGQWLRVPGYVVWQPVEMDTATAPRLHAIEEYEDGFACALPQLDETFEQKPFSITFEEDGITPRTAISARKTLIHEKMHITDADKARDAILAAFFDAKRNCLLPFDYVPRRDIVAPPMLANR